MHHYIAEPLSCVWLKTIKPFTIPVVRWQVLMSRSQDHSPRVSMINWLTGRSGLLMTAWHGQMGLFSRQCAFQQASVSPLKAQGSNKESPREVGLSFEP